MTAVFCGVTNCPVTSILIAFELFGFQGVSYYLLATAVSYAVSGYYGLYKDQTIVRVDTENNLLLVKGAVPGPKKSLVTIKETVKSL